MPKSQKEKMADMGVSLKALRMPYEAHVKEIGKNFLPRRSRFDMGKQHRSEQMINHGLINPRPRLALRTSQNGMQVGMTSQARPWFRLITVDEDMRDNEQIRQHTRQATREMFQLMERTGLYNVTHQMWGDLLWSGSDAFLLEDDLTELLRPLALVPGEYWLGANSNGRIDTLFREVEMPIQYIVGKFVYGGVPTSVPKWDRVTNDIKQAWDRGDYNIKKQVCHLIAPRHERDGRAAWMPQNKPFMSAYWQKEDVHKGGLLGDLGYDKNPIVASRWEVEGLNVYGSSPAMDALGLAKTLQVQERDKREAIRRMNRPPMNAPAELRNSGYSLSPESVNFMADPSRGLVPAYEVNPPVQHLDAEIRATEDQIDEVMYAQLFNAISRLDRRQITAREIDERAEERLVGLGPVLSRQHREKLSIIIRRYYDAAVKTGRVEPLPDDLASEPMKADYLSTLAQAQKAVAAGGLERLYGFVGNLFGADEGVIDNVDSDMAVREYADMVGAHDILRSKEAVKERRAARQAATQEQLDLENAAVAAPAIRDTAQAAQVLSETDTTRQGNILQNLGLR